MIYFNYLIMMKKTKKQFITFIKKEIKNIEKYASVAVIQLGNLFIEWLKKSTEDEIKQFLNDFEEKNKSLDIYSIIVYFNKTILNFSSREIMEKKGNCKK